MGSDRDVPNGLGEGRLRRLLEAGRALVANLEPDAILDELLLTAREMTGARYAALGILDAEQATLERFVTSGMDEETHRAIGDLPSGCGVLGVLINEPHAMRLDDVSKHPLSYGFPPEHPSMRSFLGVPVLIRGRAWGNLYLTEKAGGQPFDEADEQIASILAEWAAVAIVNARLYDGAERRRQELEQVVRRLEATTAIARAVGGETDVSRVLELIVKRGRALLGTRSVIVVLVEGDEIVVAATAGEVKSQVRGRRFPLAGSLTAEVLRSRAPMRVADMSDLRVRAGHFGVEGAQTLLIAPMLFHGRRLGVLAAIDPLDGGEFTAEDERLILGLAASAATALATAQTVERDSLRRSLEAAEQERRRWARELHDETLQGLAGLQMTLSSVRDSQDPERIREIVGQAVAQIAREIESLRALITELRPAALDELGLAPALETLVERMAASHDFAATATVELGDSRRLEPELETTVYRVVQEALTNVGKHARARQVEVEVRLGPDELTVEVRDDGHGFPVEAPTQGFGLAGMRERAALAGGRLAISSSADGTRVAVHLPVG